MALTDGSYIARLKLNNLDQPYEPGTLVPGAAFSGEAQVVEYIRRGWVDVDSIGSGTISFGEPVLLGAQAQFMWDNFHSQGLEVDYADFDYTDGYAVHGIWSPDPDAEYPVWNITSLSYDPTGGYWSGFQTSGYSFRIGQSWTGSLFPADDASNFQGFDLYGSSGSANWQAYGFRHDMMDIGVAKKYKTVETAGGTKTVTIYDVGGLYILTSASARTLTIRGDADETQPGSPVGSVVDILVTGAGTHTLAPGTGVTLSGEATFVQNGYYRLVKIATDSWRAIRIS